MTARELIELIERLTHEPLPDDNAWYGKGGLLEQAASVQPQMSDEFWHCLYHYLSDEDIRREDVAYKQRQDAALRRFLDAYRHVVDRTDSPASSDDAPA